MLGIGCIYCTGEMYCGFAVELCGLNLPFLKSLTTYPDRALCVQSDSALKGRNLSVLEVVPGVLGLILTKQVNGYELNFGIFRSVCISEMLNEWFYFIFLDGVCSCGCLWCVIGCVDVFHV